MDYPSSLLGIVRKAAIKHRDSVDQAVVCAEREWRKSPEHEQWIDQMVRGELRSLIHNVRHETNVQIRKEAGAYGQPAKTTLGTGAVARVASDVLLNYSICGVTLGMITGEQLRSFAKSEQEKADGCEFNAILCDRLAEMVPAEKCVSDCVTAKKAKAIIAEITKIQKQKKRK
jgi:hypothetical protein